MAVVVSAQLTLSAIRQKNVVFIVVIPLGWTLKRSFIVLVRVFHKSQRSTRQASVEIRLVQPMGVAHPAVGFGAVRLA